MQLAPVQAQIVLAKEIGNNEGYQKYLITIEQVKANESVGIEQAKALSHAELKIIANAGTVKQANGVGSQLRTNGFPAAGNVFGTISNVSASYMAPGTQLYVWVFDTANPYDSSQWGIFTAGSWVVPPALGAQALSTSIEVTAVQGSEAEGQLRLGTPALTFGNWRMKNFPANASAGFRRRRSRSSWFGFMGVSTRSARKTDRARRTQGARLWPASGPGPPPFRCR